MAIQRLQTASEMSLAVYEQPLIITDSGGKDSSVLVDLAIKAKIPMEIQHHHTTADAPETVYFVRDKFKRLEADGHKCEVTKPTYQGNPISMWSLIPRKMMPPTRLARYCCDTLKEQGGKNRMIATGVRWAESKNRKDSRGIYETLGSKRGDYIILANDNDDRRQLFENCQMKASRVVNPIIDWSDREIWDYIGTTKIITNSLYQCGWKRVGCIGCPMAGRKGMEWEFAQYPAYRKLYLNAFERMIQVRKAKGKDDSNSNWSTANGVFLWWMEDRNLDGQIDLFDTQSMRGDT